MDESENDCNIETETESEHEGQRNPIVPYRNSDVVRNGEARQRHGHRWSWLQIIFSAIAAIVVATFSSKWYLSSEFIDFYPDLKFNSATLYPTLYISDDNTVITNRKSPSTSRVSSGPNNLNRYTGVVMNKKLSSEKSTYFEVKTTYESLLEIGRGLLLDIGFIHPEELDKNIFLDNKQGTIYVRALTCFEDKRYICLEGHDERKEYLTYKLSSIEEYKPFVFRFGFHINPVEKVIKVTYSFNNNKMPATILYIFEETDLKASRFPVFAIDNPDSFEINMELARCGDLRFDSSTVHPMIYISDNGLEISNVATENTRRIFYLDGQLQTYEGAIGDTSFDIVKTKFQFWPKQALFGVLLEYSFTENIYSTFLFEIGMSRLKYIDKHWSVGPHRYSVSVFGHACENHNEVCLYSEREGIIKTVAILSSSHVGTHYKGVITFSINFLYRTVTISSDYASVVFENVDFTEPMWPVFALYKHIIDAKMSINKEFERSWRDKLSFWFRNFKLTSQKA